MNILYIHQYFCTRNGRSGTRSYEFAKFLVRRGHRVTVLTSASDLSDLRIPSDRSSARLDIEGIQVVAVRVPYSQRMGTLARIKSFVHFMLLSSWLALRERGHDVVIATSTPLTVGIPGMLASAAHRIPLVFEVRDLWPEAPIQMGVLRNRPVQVVLRLVERWIYRASHSVIALSPGMGEAIVASGVPPAKVTVIPNCSDLDLFTPGPADPGLRQRLGLEGRFVATHAGSIGEINGIGVIIEAAAELQRRGRDDIGILLVGQGRQQDSMQERVRQLGLRNVVFAGSVPRREVPEYLRASDACLVTVKNVPVLATASPNKMFDALAAGRPILVNCAGWMQDLVRDHAVGRCSVPGSASSLADEVCWLADHTEDAARMGVNARRLAVAEFDRRKLATAFEGVLGAAVQSRQAPHECVGRPRVDASATTAANEPAFVAERPGDGASLGRQAMEAAQTQRTSENLICATSRPIQARAK